MDRKEKNIVESKGNEKDGEKGAGKRLEEGERNKENKWLEEKVGWEIQ